MAKMRKMLPKDYPELATRLGAAGLKELLTGYEASAYPDRLAEFRRIVASGTPLTNAQLDEVGHITGALPDSDDIGGLAELALAWVLANPLPVPLAGPGA